MVDWLHCFWDYWEAEHHGGEARWNRAALLMVAKRQRDRMGLGTMNTFRASPSDLLPSTRPHLLLSTVSQ
jgi:hypothetical protein